MQHLYQLGQACFFFILDALSYEKQFQVEIIFSIVLLIPLLMLPISLIIATNYKRPVESKWSQFKANHLSKSSNYTNNNSTAIRCFGQTLTVAEFIKGTQSLWTRIWFSFPITLEMLGKVKLLLSNSKTIKIFVAFCVSSRLTKSCLRLIYCLINWYYRDSFFYVYE